MYEKLQRKYTKACVPALHRLLHCYWNTEVVLLWFIGHIQIRDVTLYVGRTAGLLVIGPDIGLR